MKLVLIAILLGELTITSYRSVKHQTDSTPFYTSTGAHVEAGGVAISRDLLCGACRRLHRRCRRPDYEPKLHYGDWLYIEGYGFRFINDVMGETYTIRHKGKVRHKPITNQIDIWVRTYNEEKTINRKKLKVFKIKEILTNGR